MKVLLVILGALVAASAWGQEVKGLSLGMSKARVDQLYPGGMDDKSSFTVAGVRSKYSTGPTLTYKDDKLAMFTFFFKAEEFDNVVTALKEKYPQLKCTESSVGNAMGAKFTQTDCKFSNLRLNRFVGDIKTSVLSLLEPASVSEWSRKGKQERINDL